ncbi:putative membrane protein [Candidatus Nanobsidianus stetteri]|uniref:Putative membrane protein n=1 Tax=Nanobsidianus stetteri TaxID=1294122 RepID=R1E5B8_NANST|nr:putative membrane protein [Candidatus Nanobsidianus stetteri]
MDENLSEFLNSLNIYSKITYISSILGFSSYLLLIILSFFSTYNSTISPFSLIFSPYLSLSILYIFLNLINLGTILVILIIISIISYFISIEYLKKIFRIIEKIINKEYYPNNLFSMIYIGILISIFITYPGLVIVGISNYLILKKLYNIVVHLNNQNINKYFRISMIGSIFPLLLILSFIGFYYINKELGKYNLNSNSF